MIIQTSVHLFENYSRRWDIIIPVILFVSLLCWRAWKFTIAPALYPQRVKELPYWIPILGHTVSFFLNAPAVVDAGMYVNIHS